ncbi:hypothetical protein QKU48_gp0196 [Fadolivirus algeromassiliense]|jgi:hypothetical protein|uniref:Uncharacterized protein n=1 Tax=Fadolivirus FV1/VV64 TaxID=3070911 RepID=A0A7D3UV42_9VIRU|nr:hypothetical protein QKU48_gp0196 [Fadolivirus algeromassiliense]QKF93654.1 hypothetical protein Fadolivirus_1_196 [Fadolivirus FV1/VV64]
MSDSEEYSGDDKQKENIHKRLENKYLLKGTSYQEIYNDLISANLTQPDFNNFIIAATNGKTNSFISKTYSGYYANSAKKTVRKQIIDLMFTKFKPNDKQFKLLCSCYSVKNTYNVCWHWIDVLVDQDYQFTDPQKQMINKAGYGEFYKLMDDGLNIETIRYYVNELNKYNEPDIEELIVKINSMPEKLPSDYLKLFLKEYKASKYGTTNDVHELIVALIEKCILDDSIIDQLAKSKYRVNSIINALINNVELNDTYTNFLLDNKEFHDDLNVLFNLSVTQDYKITTSFINKMLVKGKICYCKYKPTDLSKFGLKYEDLIQFNLNKNFKIPIAKQIKEKSKKIEEDDLSEEEHVSLKKKPAKKAVKGIRKMSPKRLKKVFDESESEGESEIEEVDEDCEEDDDYKSPSKDELKFKVISLFGIFGLAPDNETMKLICENGYLNEFNELVSKYKMVPNKECLDMAVSNILNVELIKQIICYKISPNSDTFNKLINNTIDNEVNVILEIIELMIKNGLQLSINDIHNLIKKGYYLNDLDRFGIQYDEKLYYVCFVGGKEIPKEYESKFNIDKKVFKLRTMCGNTTPKLSATKFRDYLIKNNIKPDRYCLDNAARIGNSNLMSYIIYELKCVPTIFTLYETSNISCKEDIYQELIKNYNITYEDMIKPYDHIDLTKLQKN